MGRILIDETTMRAAMNRADDAFWTEVAKVFPFIKTGDLSPDAHVPFMAAARAAIEAWVDENTPELVLPDATGYYWILAEHGDTGHKSWQIANYLGDDRWRRFGFANEDTSEFIGIVEYKGPLTLADLANPPAPPAVEWRVVTGTVKDPVGPMERWRVEYGPSPGGKSSVAYVDARSAQEAMDIVLKVHTAPIDIARAVTEAEFERELAAKAERKEPDFDGSSAAAREDWHAFVNMLPDHNGWTAAWEYPGFLCWHKDGMKFSIVATPDWDSGDAEELVCDVQDTQGERVNSLCKAIGWEGGVCIPWSKSERTIASYMAHVRPVLEKVDAVAEEYRNAVRRTLIDAHLEEEGEFEVTNDIFCPIDEELPGAWVSVEIWVDARDLTGEPVEKEGK